MFNGILQEGKCYCLSALAAGASRLQNGQCRAKCPGDRSQNCGGKGTISVFNHGFFFKGKLAFYKNNIKRKLTRKCGRNISYTLSIKYGHV